MVSTEGRTIAVVGATGRQGREVIRNLLEKGWKARALTRKPESKKAKALQQLGAEVIKVELDDKASLEAAFENAYGVYNMQAPVPGRIEVEIRQGRNVAEAAKRTGVRHVVYGSAGVGNQKTGIEQWDAKIEVTQAMKDLDLPLTTLRPMAFMELMSDPSYYPNTSVWYIWPRLSGSGCRIVWLSVQDLGVIAAKVFADPDEYIGRELALASDVQSLENCREIYKEVMGKYPSRFPMPMFMFEKFVGRDIPNMWRWLRTNPVSLDIRQTMSIYPQAQTVRSWLEGVKTGRRAN